ncbi:MAG TPA: thioredoxin domain-containing protein [Rhizomicrobium sp.]
MSRKSLLIALGAVVLIAAAAIGYYVVNGSGSTATAAGAGYEVLPTDKTQGNPKSKVVLIEYAAPSCPVCAAFNEMSFGKLKTNYIDNGKIFYVFRVFPIAPEDGPAEKLARCLPEDKYFPFIDLLFRNQRKWDHEYGLTPDQVHEGLILMARIAGVSAEQADRCMAPNKAEDDRINKVSADGESRYSITGTPTFIVNGVSAGAGNIPYETLAKLLDTELAKQK